MKLPKRIKPVLDYIQKNNRIVLVGAFIVIGLATLLISRAAIESLFVEPEDGTKSGPVSSLSSSLASGGGYIKFGSGTTSNPSCGKREQNYAYQVPFGNAVWNQPACSMPVHAQSTEYVNRFTQWSYKNAGDPSTNRKNGILSVSPGFKEEEAEGKALYTTEVYYASNATTEKSVSSITYTSNFDGIKWNSTPKQPKPGYKSNHPDLKMPWNPAWKYSTGGDNQLLVIDDRETSATKGAIFSLWQTGMGDCAADALEGSLPYPLGGWGSNRLCAGSVQITRDPAGQIVDYKSYEGQTGDRGVGLSYYATLTTPEEVEAGEIRHALGVAIPNTSLGPTCTAAQLAAPIDWNVVGKLCGTAFAPASKHEHGKNNGGSDKLLHTHLGSDQYSSNYNAIYTQEKLIPEGARFRLRQDFNIEAWISSRSDFQGTANKRRADTARIFARALQDYGMIIVDTNGYSPSVQTVGGLNPDHATMWKNLGLGPEHKDNLLEGLVTASNMQLLEPPTATCPDGTTSKFFCEWTSIRY